MELGLKSLGELLKKTRSRLTKGADLHDLLIVIVAHELQTPVSSFTLNIKDKVISIKAHPAIKNELQIKKAALLKKIKERCGDAIEDVR